jgi:hypothetical protein
LLFGGVGPRARSGEGAGRQAGVWALTPLTAVVDVPITAGSTIAFFGYWFGYYPFFGR